MKLNIRTYAKKVEYIYLLKRKMYVVSKTFMYNWLSSKRFNSLCIYIY